MHAPESRDCLVLFAQYLDQLLLQLVDGQARPLLQDGHLGLLAVGHRVAPEGVPLPLREVRRHGADAPHVGRDLPTLVCTGETRDQ